MKKYKRKEFNDMTYTLVENSKIYVDKHGCLWNFHDSEVEQVKPDYTAMAVEYVKGLLESDKEAFEDNYDFIERAYEKEYGDIFDMGQYCDSILYLTLEIRALLNKKLEDKQ